MLHQVWNLTWSFSSEQVMSTQKINTVAHNSEFIGICSAITLPSIRSVLTCAVISPSLLPAPSTNEHDDVFAGRRQPALHAGSHLPSSTAPFPSHPPWAAWMSTDSCSLHFLSYSLFQGFLWNCKIRNDLVVFDTVDLIFSRIAVFGCFMSHIIASPTQSALPGTWVIL